MGRAKHEVPEGLHGSRLEPCFGSSQFQGYATHELLLPQHYRQQHLQLVGSMAESQSPENSRRSKNLLQPNQYLLRRTGPPTRRMD